MNSLTTRLFIMLSLITAFSLTVFGWIMYSGLQNYLEESAKKKLFLMADTIAKDIHPDQSPVLQQKKQLWFSTIKTGPPIPSNNLLLAVWDADGHLLYQSDGRLEDTIPYHPHKRNPSHFARFSLNKSTLFSGLWISFVPNSSKNTSTAQFELVKPETPGSITLLVAYEDEEYDEFLNSIFFWLCFGGTGVTLAVGLTGLRGIKWALQPLSRMAQDISRIDANSLSYRLDNPESPREMQNTIKTINNLLIRLETSFLREKQFSADVSHELRTPLSALQCAAEAANLKTCNQSSHHDSLQLIESVAQEMNDIVENLLLLARTEVQSEIPDIHSLNFIELVSDAIESIVPIAKKRSIDVSWNPPSEPIVVQGNESWLRQMVVNLFSNAICFNRERGHIWVNVKKSDGVAELSISDSGIGIPVDLQGKIFERFFRVAEARDRQSGGSGLGLSLARSIAHAHKGGITVVSSPAKGSTFMVQLPINKA